MAELRTPGERSQEKPPFDPPRGDEGLEDWFARRLESQGIRARRARIPFARILAVVALVAALIALVVVLKAASGGSTTAAVTTPATHPNAPTGGTTTPPPKKAKKPLWKQVKLTVLNGFGGANAAGTAKVDLQRAGWTVIGVADAAPDTTSTIVVYVPGFLNQAKVVAARLGLPAPVPIDQAPGVIPTQTDSVAIVLGQDLLPNGAG
ncbi:MAG: LytR C-terminal domain-containing protein [Gaiellales bacterium]